MAGQTENGNICRINQGDEEICKKSHTYALGSGPFLLAAVTGASVIAGFGATLALARKKDPLLFAKGLQSKAGESGTSLALRALGWGSVYAVGGVSIVSILAWKFGREPLQSISSRLPQIPKNNPQGKNDFKTVRELVTYIIEGENKS